MEHSWSFQGKSEWIKSLKASPFAFKRLTIEWFLYEILLSQYQVTSWFSKCKIKANDLSIASPNQEHHTQLEV